MHPDILPFEDWICHFDKTITKNNLSRVATAGLSEDVIFWAVSHDDSCISSEHIHAFR